MKPHLRRHVQGNHGINGSQKDVMARIAQGVSKPRGRRNEGGAGMLVPWIEYLGTVPGGLQALADPKHVWNALDGSQEAPQKVLAYHGLHNVYKITPGDKQQITVHACFSADSNFMPPFLLYPRERL